MKIANKIIITIAILSALTVALIGYFSGTYSIGIIKSQIFSYLQSSSKARAEHIRTFLQEQKKTSEILAAASVYLDLLKTPKTSDQFPAIMDKIEKRFARTIVVDKNILEIYILDKNGKVIAGSDEDEINEDRSKDKFFINAKSGTYIKEPYFYNNLNKTVYTVSSPIKDNNGEFLGVSVLMFTPEIFYEIVRNENGLGDTEENFLIDSNKYFLTPSRFLGKEVVLKTKVETENANHCFDKDEIDYIARNGYVSSQYRKVFESKDYRGVDIIGMHAYIPETGWCLITKVDRTALTQNIFDVTIVNIIVLGLAFILVVLAVYYITNRILKGIKVLEKDMAIVKEGNLDIKIKDAGNDEIGSLSKSFSNMIDFIKESRKDVDKKVQEQTLQLRDKATQLENQQKAILNILEDVEAEKMQAQKLAAIVEGSNEAILGKTLDGIVTEWNTGAEQLYGWTAKEIIGKPIKTIVPPEKYEELDNIMNRVGLGEKIDHFQTVRVKKSGQKVEVSLSASPIKDSSGKITGISVIAIDITKEKQIDKAKTEFVSLASHQLRTPLSTINWYAEMLLDGDAGKLNEEQMKFLNEIYTGNKRMVDLVNALLNVSRLELGTFMVEPAPCDLEKIAKQVIGDILPQMKSKKQSFTEEYQKDLGEVNADKKLMDIIFQNLLSNAMKYTPEKGKIKLSIKKDKENYIISVSDNGLGIPKESADKIFTKLYRADNVRESDTVGTGLGLYMVKSIIDQTGGKIWFESQVNKGTTFFVTIPLSGMKKKEGTKKLN